MALPIVVFGCHLFSFGLRAVDRSRLSSDLRRIKNGFGVLPGGFGVFACCLGLIWVGLGFCQKGFGMEQKVSFLRTDRLFPLPDACWGHPDAVGARPDAVLGHPDTVKARPDAVKAPPDTVLGHPDAVKACPDAVEGTPPRSFTKNIPRAGYTRSWRGKNKPFEAPAKPPSTKVSLASLVSLLSLRVVRGTKETEGTGGTPAARQGFATASFESTFNHTGERGLPVGPRRHPAGESDVRFAKLAYLSRAPHECVRQDAGHSDQDGRAPLRQSFRLNLRLSFYSSVLPPLVVLADYK